MLECAEVIHGWMYKSELAWLAEQASRMQSVIEVGCWKGRSTYALLAACQGPVYAVDTFAGTPGTLASLHPGESTLPEFLRNVGHFTNLRVVVGTADQWIDEIRLSQPGGCVDMTFIDGDHSYDAVRKDIGALAPYTRRLICGHDIDKKDCPGVRRAVQELIGTPRRGPGSIWYWQL
jgi:Methyltransferase domain